MKKKISLFLFALALVATALVHRPAEAACLKPACLLSPACCFASECVAWCNSRGGGTPVCQGAGGGEGGCCACNELEG
jgi:hypothetical protein